MISKITTHRADALARLLYQYQDSPKFKALIDSVSGVQTQDTEDAVYELYSRLDIDGSSGISLDKIGELIGAPRSGLDDASYRIYLKGTAGENISEGEADRIIDTWQTMTQGTVIQMLETFPAEIVLASNGTLVDPLLTLACILIQRVVGGGIKVLGTVFFDSDGAFTFDLTTETWAKGFGDKNDINIGGKFAGLLYPAINFGFAGTSDPSIRGFSDLNDPQSGGRFRSL